MNCGLWNKIHFLISGCRRDVDEICALLGYYAAYSGNFSTTFRDKLSAPGLTRCPETSVRNCHCTLRNIHKTGYPGTSVRNCHCTLRNIPAERRFHKIHSYIYLKQEMLVSSDSGLHSWYMSSKLPLQSWQWPRYGAVRRALAQNTQDFFCCSLSRPYWQPMALCSKAA